jgi:O-antigen/teichoic acid export membrane protein
VSTAEVGESPAPRGNEPSLKRALSKDVLVYGAGDFANKALGFISVPIYTRIFVPDEYAALALAATLSALISGLLILGGDTALARFWFEDESAEAHRRLVTTWIGFLAIWGLAVALVLAPVVPAFVRFSSITDVGGTIDNGRYVLFWVALAILPIALVSRMLAQILRNEFRALAYAATSVAIGATGLPIGLLAVTQADLGVTGIFIGILTGESIALLARLWLTRASLRGRFDGVLLRRLLRFALPLVPVTLSFWVFTASDRVVLGKLGSLEELGYYSLALSIASIFALATGAVGQAWMPRAIRLYETDKPRAARVIGASLTYYVFVLGLAAVLISAFAPEIIRIVASSTYAKAATVLPLLVVGSVAYGTNILTASGMTLTHRTGPLALASGIAAVVNVAFALALVPPLGMIGAALASVLGYVVLTGLYLWISQRLWPMVLEVRRLVTIVVALGVTVLLTSDIWELPLAARALLPVAFVAAVVLIAGTTPLDRSIAGALRRR